MLMLLLGKGIYGQLPALPAPPPHTPRTLVYPSGKERFSLFLCNLFNLLFHGGENVTQ